MDKAGQKNNMPMPSASASANTPNEEEVKSLEAHEQLKALAAEKDAEIAKLKEQLEKAQAVKAKPKKKFLEKDTEVVATRKGFYKNQRRAAGDKFKVAKGQALGEWMKPI